jgi:hypothetical protein
MDGTQIAARARRAGGTPQLSRPRTYTVVLSAAAEHAMERDLPEAAALAVADSSFGPLAGHPGAIVTGLRPG